METPPQEVVTATWQEAVGETPVLPAHFRVLLITGGSVLTLGFIALGFWLQTLNWYLAALVTATAVAAVLSQNRRQEVPRAITLTSQRIVINKQSYLLEDLRGFWLQEDEGRLVVALEPKRRTLLPITCYYQNNHEDEAQALLAQALPEVEPRPSHFSDQFNRYFRF